jgi:hypothetical protein
VTVDPHRALRRALARRHPDLHVLASRSEPWASATFIGARHELDCAAGADLTGLESADFALPGHIVADVAVFRTGDRLRIEALTIEDARSWMV